MTLRISSWSRIAVIRAAISRSARSASAARVCSPRERASSSISRAFVMAIAAWLASVWINWPSSASKACGRRE
jgi:hypothetical protein